MPADFLDHPVPLAFAHRGGAGHFPENTWRAFEHAVGLGYAYLETDAHATADGVLVAFHDKTLDRVTDRTGRDRRAARQRGGRGQDRRHRPDTRCSRTCSTAWPDVRFNIDVKDAPAARPLAELLRRTGGVGPGLHHLVLGRPAHAPPAGCSTAPVCMAASPASAAGAAVRPARPGCWRAGFARRWVRCAQLPVAMATAPIIGRAHAAGLQVHVWTVNEPRSWTALLDLGRGRDHDRPDRAAARRADRPRPVASAGRRLTGGGAASIWRLPSGWN